MSLHWATAPAAFGYGVDMELGLYTHGHDLTEGTRVIVNLSCVISTLRDKGRLQHRFSPVEARSCLLRKQDLFIYKR